MGKNNTANFDPNKQGIVDLISQYTNRTGRTGATAPTATPDTKTGALPQQAEDRVQVEGEASFKKYSDAALRKNVARGLWAVSTGIGLCPIMAAALAAPTMVVAAKMFFDNPSHARTEKGAKMLTQLMTNVEGFMELGADKKVEE